ncbi:uncharacterized protein ACBR49_019734 [Aulostomus maculatus]
MDQAEERVIEEVRKYDHLYNSSSKHYKDCQMANNSWREISQSTGLEVAECMKKWKNLRDKYVRLRKRMATRSGDPAGQKVPAFYHFLSWLAPHMKHREMDSNYVAKSPLSRPKRKRDQTEDWLMRQIANLEERKMELQQKATQGTDECSRFGQTVADLRRVPEDRRPDVMFKVYTLIHESKQ